MADNRSLVTLPAVELLETIQPEILKAFPGDPPRSEIERYARVVQTALNKMPDLWNKCDRHSLIQAMIQCAQDGLYPDGREAALVPYQGKVQYLPMVYGYRKRMQGQTLGCTTAVVHANDSFRWTAGDDAEIQHIPTPLGAEKGEAIGAYCIIKLKTGESIREVMDTDEINRIRDRFSKATRDDAPWKIHWEEMARKTVLKRAGKQVVFEDHSVGSMFVRGGDDDYIPLAETPLPPRITAEDVGPNGPRRSRSRGVKQAEPAVETVMSETIVESENPAPAEADTADGSSAPATQESTAPPEPRYSFGDAVGEMWQFERFDEAVAVYTECLERCKNDQKAIATVWENGHNLRAALINDGHSTAVTLLNDLHHLMTQPPAQEQPAPAQEQPAPANGNAETAAPAPVDPYFMPYDRNRQQAWYKDAAATLDQMRRDNAPREEFAKWQAANKAALDELKGPGQFAFRPLWNLLEKPLLYGLNRGK